MKILEVFIMEEISKNSIDFIKVAGDKIKGKFGKAFLGTLFMVAPLMLCVFSIYATPLAILFFGVFQTGYIRFMRALMNGENPSYKLIFSEFRTPWLEIFLGTIMICMFVIGSILVVIPGVILIAYYSMTLFVAEKEKLCDPGVALKETSKKMNGNIASMFAFKTFFWAFFILTAFLGAMFSIIAAKAWADYKVFAVLFYIFNFLLITVIWSIIKVYYHASCELFFNEMMTIQEIKKTKKEEKKVEIINEGEAEPKKEEVVEQPQEAEKEEKVEKVAPKKTSTKKPSTAPAKKSAEKKATATKTSKTKTTK